MLRNKFDNIVNEQTSGKISKKCLIWDFEPVVVESKDFEYR